MAPAKKDRERLIEKARQLRASGMSNIAIARQLSSNGDCYVCDETIRQWLGPAVDNQAQT
jgi:hypothetical protein